MIKTLENRAKTGSKLRTDCTKHTDGTIMRKSREFEVRQHATRTIPQPCTGSRCSVRLTSHPGPCGTAAPHSATASSSEPAPAVGTQRLRAAPRHPHPSGQPRPARARTAHATTPPPRHGRSRGECPQPSGCRRWAFCTRGFSGVENIIPKVLHGKPQLAPQPPPHNKEFAIRGDLLLVKGPQNFAEQRVNGGVQLRDLGGTLTCFLSGVHCVNRAPCMC